MVVYIKLSVYGYVNGLLMTINCNFYFWNDQDFSIII